MGETFYKVLGVNQDADTEAIKQAYREKVKDHHPDVSDDDDAAETFKRLTDARDVLTDEKRRAQYDRVGHETYVRRYLESNAWDLEGSDEHQGSTGRSHRSRRTGSPGGSRRTGSGSDWTTDGDVSWGQERDDSNRWASSSSNDGRDETGGSDETDTDRGSENAENYQRYRAGASETGEAGDENPFGSKRRERRKRRRQSWTDDAETTDGTSSPDGTETGPGASRAGPDPTGSRSRSTRGGSSAGTTGPTRGSTGSARAEAETATGARSPPGGADGGWPGAHAAANTYSPSGRESGPVSPEPTVSGNFGAIVRDIGPWLAFHFVFLVSAFVTIWLFLGWAAGNAALSIPALFVSLLVLGITVFFSILHMVSQVYS